MSSIASKRAATTTFEPLSSAQGAPSEQTANTGIEMPAWAVSLLVHVAVLGLFWMIKMSVPQKVDVDITSAIDQIDPETFKFDPTVVDQVGSDSKANTLAPSRLVATQVARDPQKEMQKKLDEKVLQVHDPERNEIARPSESELVDTIPTTTGATDVVEGGVEGAIDRLAWEISGSLKERKTLVIWLMDASQSLNSSRDLISRRFENVYRQLGLLKTDVSNQALLTGVVSYGEKYEFLTPEPVADHKVAAEAVRKIKPDTSGKEYVFTALDQVLRKWKNYRTSQNRNVMVVIVTDERGDDYQHLEKAIVECKRNKFRVFCVGHASLFGQEKGYHTWKYSDGSTEDIEVDQGPETVAPEHVVLPFWGGDSRGLDRLSAGFGPYALTRLCAETGGLYLITEQSHYKFDHAVMRRYLPDYRPIREYEKELIKSTTKRALVTAAKSTWDRKIPEFQVRFQADNDTVLRQQITEAQRPAAVLDFRFNEVYSILQQGEKDRAKLDTDRWRASYDLAMGRVLALRVRAFGYNQMLADMKASPLPFKEKGLNMWTLVPSKTINGPPQIRKMAEQSEKYLTAVIDKHPNTPWALLAEKELSRSMGWKWEPGTMPITNRGRMNDRNGLDLADDDDPKKAALKKKAAAERANKPKL